MGDYHTIGKMRTKPVDPQADGLAADDHTAFGEEILDISRTQREAMVDPNRISNDLTRITKALQARHGRRDPHAKPLPAPAASSNLAMPLKLFGGNFIHD